MKKWYATKKVANGQEGEVPVALARDAVMKLKRDGYFVHGPDAGLLSVLIEYCENNNYSYLIEAEPKKQYIIRTQFSINGEVTVEKVRAFLGLRGERRGKR